MNETCPHCNQPIKIRNPSGYCDHLYYPENCKICQEIQSKKVPKWLIKKTKKRIHQEIDKQRR